MSISEELAEIKKIIKIVKQGVPDVGHCHILARCDNACLISFETKIKLFSIQWDINSRYPYYKLKVRQTEHSGYCDVPFDPNGDILTEIDFIGFPQDNWDIFSFELYDDTIDIVFFRHGRQDFLDNLNKAEKA